MSISFAAGCGQREAPRQTVVDKKSASNISSSEGSNEKPVPQPVEPAAPPPILFPKPPVDKPPREKPAAEKVYRPSAPPRKFDEEKLARRGIKKYESRHLRLFTDIAPELARPLPALVDAAYVEWEKYFGALAPDRDGKVFQITGYLMADPEKFREQGLYPDDLPRFIQGRHRAAEFWMFDQATDYYREHLVVHEGTHCFMSFVPNSPLALRGIVTGAWYVEGMAELFGTHETDAAGKIHFRVFPAQKIGFANWGRTEIIHEEIRAGRGKTLHQVLDLHPESFLKNESYGWSWGLCQFLEQHPRYAARFHRLVKEVRPHAVTEDFRSLYSAELADLEEEWLLFTANIVYGYDIARAAIDFKAGQPLGIHPVHVEISAGRGWQSSGVEVVAGQEYRITAQGRCAMAQKPKPWESEPQGISIRYAQGHPIGLLLGTIRASKPPETYPQTTMLKTFAVGRELRLKPETSGTLYLRVNDFWNELADNTGAYQVEISPLGR